MLSMKGFQEQCALVDKTIDSFCVRGKMHGSHPLRDRSPTEANHAIATQPRTS